MTPTDSDDRTPLPRDDPSAARLGGALTERRGGRVSMRREGRPGSFGLPELSAAGSVRGVGVGGQCLVAGCRVLNGRWLSGGMCLFELFLFEKDTRSTRGVPVSSLW